jgi:hypothetical protein
MRTDAEIKHIPPGTKFVGWTELDKEGKISHNQTKVMPWVIQRSVWASDKPDEKEELLRARAEQLQRFEGSRVYIVEGSEKFSCRSERVSGLVRFVVVYSIDAAVIEDKTDE